MSDSIICNDQECFICGKRDQLHKHHIYHTTANRQVSEAEGCWVYLCGYHHNLSNEGVHYNTPFDITLKKLCQIVWEQKGERDEFRKLFGKSWL